MKAPLKETINIDLEEIVYDIRLTSDLFYDYYYSIGFKASLSY